jgi:hypothetical protein
MKNTNDKLLRTLFIQMGLLSLLMGPAMTYAQIQVTLDWGTGTLPDGRRLPEDQDEAHQLRKVALTLVKSRLATAGDAQSALELPFKLAMDDARFYIQPATFMAQSQPGEVCTPVGKVLNYQCKEGQRYTQACHIALFDANFREVGWHTIRINESAPVFCNAVPAIGVFNADRNELLVTVQYFFIDGKRASKMSEVGSGWKRMTVLLKLKADKDHIAIEQDDGCLGNPNRVDTIPDARKTIKHCESQAQH